MITYHTKWNFILFSKVKSNKTCVVKFNSKALANFSNADKFDDLDFQFKRTKN